MDYVESLGKKFSPFLQTKKLQRTDSKVNLEINAPLAIKQGWLAVYDKKWKESWVVLRPDSLDYYSKSKLGKYQAQTFDPNTSKKPLVPKVIPLNVINVSIVEVEMKEFSSFWSNSKKATFKIESHKGKVFISSNDIENTESWIDSIRAVIVCFNSQIVRQSKSKNSLDIPEHHWTKVFKQELKHIAYSITIIQDNFLKDNNFDIRNQMSSLSECLLQTIEACRILLVNSSNVHIQTKILLCLKDMNDLLSQISKMNPTSPMVRNINDLMALITNSSDKLEAAFNPPAPDPEKIPQEQLMDSTKVMLTCIKSMISNFKSNTMEKIPEAAKEMIQSMQSIKLVVEKISTETSYSKILLISEKLHGIIAEVITLANRILKNKIDVEAFNHLATIASRTLIACTKDLISENQIAEQYLIAQRQLVSTTEAIQKATKKLEQAETKLDIAFFSKLCSLANILALRISKILNSMKEESGTQLFQGIKELAVVTSEFTKYSESISGPIFLNITKNKRTTTVQSHHQIQFLEYIKNVRNCGIQLVGEAKSVLHSPFESRFFLKLAATATTLGQNVVTVLKHIEDFISPQIQKQIEEEEKQLTTDSELWDKEWEDEPNDENYIITETEPNGEEHLKCGTLNQLIYWLTRETKQDLKFQKSFLVTYRSFVSPHELFAKLVQRYNVKVPKLPRGISVDEYHKSTVKPIKLRVVNVMRMWIETCFFDFDEELLNKFEYFITNKLDDSQLDNYEELRRQLRNAITKQKSSHQAFSRVSTTLFVKVDEQFSTPDFNSNSSPSDFVFKFSSEELAQQITVIDSIIFSQIKPVELLNQAWSKSELKHLSPNTLHLIKRFNQLSAWAATAVVWQTKIADRVQVWEKLIELTEQLKKINNFNSLLAIISGLNNSAVYRLKYSREELSDKAKKPFEQSMLLMSSKNSFKVYREALRKSSPPIIPYLGVCQTDLTFIEEGNKDTLGGLINFRKRELTSDIILELQLHQQTLHKFDPNFNLISLLEHLPYHDDEKLYQLSLLIEPRNAERADIQ